MNTISDLPDLLPDLLCVTVHGKGRGGGETVSDNIVAAYSKHRRLSQLPVGCSISEKIRMIRSFKGTVGLANKKPIRVLCAAGPRDIPFIMLLVFFRIRYAVYIQVPYRTAITISDPVHGIVILTFMCVVRLTAKRFYANSRWSGEVVSSRLIGSRSKEVHIILPINELPKERAMIKDKPGNGYGYKEKPGKDGVVAFATCARLFTERGIGSRDYESIERMLRVMLIANNNEGKRKYYLNHYGDVAPEIKIRLKEYGEVINYKGYDRKWVEKEAGPFIFLSKYEGFGLAAYEAAIANKVVFVNQGFPRELTRVMPMIKRINDIDKWLRELILLPNDY